MLYLYSYVNILKGHSLDLVRFIVNRKPERERGDNGQFITLDPKVLQSRIIIR